ncbi:Ppx/GppA family phosphatase [Ideonella azotifigens]|uniref:Exopolyphosphatase n=1 Tax=Ideonella azotifigens TaxID=513160 RepID=A0ABN1JHD9_9BURK|nr:Ppx/GppA phosphatase family protein [Ideonella azotifigens]MCD2343621.1 Ppx/GppA family phosphatase [Ideonella azotifigens]
MPLAASFAQPPASGPLASIDMGSNSFRLEIGQLRDGRYRRLQYLKETVRLGAGLDAQGLLTEEASERGLACLRRFAGTLSGMRPGQVRAVATQTLREARNRDAFLRRAQEALGFPIEVISGREEARLIYAGVAKLQPSHAERLVIDIGGRSTEMILGCGRTPSRAESFQVGSVSLSMRYFADGRFSAEAFRAAQIAAGAEFEEALQPFARSLWKEALGSSGTAGAVSEVLRDCGVTDGRITPDGLRWLMQRCIEAGSADKLNLPGMKADRKPVIGGGLAILYTLAMHFQIDALLPAKGALRQGVIVDLHDRLLAHERAPGGDAHADSVRVLQKRFEVDTAQAARVTDVATELYSQLAAQPDEQALTALRRAAQLHELGRMVSHHDHHRHSAYLLAHVDAPGWSQSEQRQLAELVLGQRGGLKKVDELIRRGDAVLQLLSLRLAVILCHARGGDEPTPQSLQLQRKADKVTLQTGAEWANLHPRTLHLLREEAQAWSDPTLPISLVIGAAKR